MNTKPVTLFSLTEAGKSKNTSGVFSSTKRKGKWIDTPVDTFFEKVRHFALGLYDLGIRKGDKVALHSENSTEWFITDQAVLSLGAINVPIYTTQPGDQIKFILENSEAKIYIYSNDELFKSFKPHVGELPGLKLVNLIETSDDRAISMESILEKGKALDGEKPELFEELRSKVSADDLASLIYTSGTTGRPKGVMLTHHNISSNVLSSIERIPFDVEGERGSKLLSYLPLSHIFERMLNYLYFYIGYPLYYIEKLEEIKDDIQHVKPMFFATVPRLLEKVYNGIKDKTRKEPGLKGKIGTWALTLADTYSIDDPPSGLTALKFKIADLLVYKKIRAGLGGNLQGFISGGAALAPSLMNFFTAVGFKCHQGYGLTETSPVLTVTTENAIKTGSAGKVIEGVELKIDDDGEILARGPNIMKGYYKNPEATAEVMSDDGWFRTGDIGKIDKDGFLFITDRKKDIFKLSTGKYVAPQHVENTLLKSPMIEQVIVLGAKRKFCSALIVPNMDAVKDRLGDVNEDSPEFSEKVEKLIRSEVDKLNEPLPKWEKIKKYALLDELFSIDSGELTPTLKTKRRVIHDKYGHIIENIYGDEKES